VRDAFPHSQTLAQNGAPVPGTAVGLWGAAFAGTYGCAFRLPHAALGRLRLGTTRQACVVAALIGRTRALPGLRQNGLHDVMIMRSASAAFWPPPPATPEQDHRLWYQVYYFIPSAGVRTAGHRHRFLQLFVAFVVAETGFRLRHLRRHRARSVRQSPYFRRCCDPILPSSFNWSSVRANPAFGTCRETLLLAARSAKIRGPTIVAAGACTASTRRRAPATLTPLFFNNQGRFHDGMIPVNRP